MKNKRILLSVMPIIMAGIVSAEGESCGITNLGTCLIEKFFEFLLTILNAPVKPLLDMTYNLLTQPVNISIFSGIWGIIVYILSMFYGILLMYVGFKFVISGHSYTQREKAKTGLANTIIMVVLVQASYYLYILINEVVSSVTTVILNLVQQNFFLLTIDNTTNVGLELLLLIPYLITILLTLILLVLRYMIVSFGVVFFALGIFFYFIGPLKNYGKLILNTIFIVISLTFFYALIFLASSKLLDLTAFQNTKILVMIGAFSIVNFGTIILILFAIFKSVRATPITQIISVAKAVA